MRTSWRVLSLRRSPLSPAPFPSAVRRLPGEEYCDQWPRSAPTASSARALRRACHSPRPGPARLRKAGSQICALIPPLAPISKNVSRSAPGAGVPDPIRRASEAQTRGTCGEGSVSYTHLEWDIELLGDTGIHVVLADIDVNNVEVCGHDRGNLFRVKRGVEYVAVETPVAAENDDDVLMVLGSRAESCRQILRCLGGIGIQAGVWRYGLGKCQNRSRDRVATLRAHNDPIVAFLHPNLPSGDQHLGLFRAGAERQIHAKREDRNSRFR